ncbi:Arylsulfatase [Rubripirellula tenax]|uniref:Arylsulfatase n=1 Tax=Rubripirellula tenax TaxID=2528015 RepID=A0A5C6EBA1_9BACT|nr:sulfatase-like hydrolase/transferase [Rubripirellula tenax]TWU46252.1 Arylsulfatase [Rubripirellula tenax]
MNYNKNIFRWLLPVLIVASLQDIGSTKDKSEFSNRYNVFKTFRIKGAGGTDHMELAARYGANTIRTWSVSEDTKTWLEDASRLNQKMILGIWMPHQGTNNSRGVTYEQDYRESRPKILNRLNSTLDQYDDHPSVLMWGLGNEVHLDEHYLKTVNEMAKVIHGRNPNRLTCVVIINAPKSSIDLIQKHAPEVDMIGVNSYGRGAMQNAIKNLEEHWKKPYFFSEYSCTGPWSAAKGVGDLSLETVPTKKVQELRDANGALHLGKNNCGGVVFVWGEHVNGMDTWFSMLLPQAPTQHLRLGETPLVTAMADEMHRAWTGLDVENHAPLISAMTINQSARGATVAPNQNLDVAVDASDDDGEDLTHRYWIFPVDGNKKQSAVTGPIDGDALTTVKAPTEPGNYRLLCQVDDGNGKTAVHHVPVIVEAETVRPNILLIFSDDAGYGDFGFQGSKQFKTPQIDRLASSGVICTNGYVSASVCSPSRAGLLTGRYQQRFGFFMNLPTELAERADDPQGLPVNELTFADALKECGYRTGAIGKWHQGEDARFHPNRRGFDYFYGFLGGHRSYFPIPPDGSQPSQTLMRNQESLPEGNSDSYTTDLFTDDAIRFINLKDASNQPFFLYLSYNAVHGPMDSLDEDRAPYDDLKNEKRRNLGGMTAALDRGVGRILDELDDAKIRDNTLVVFVNDNGGGEYIAANNWPLRGYKGHEWEGGNRVPFVFSWPGHLKAGTSYDQTVISLDLFPTFLSLAGGDAGTLAKPLDGVSLMPFLRGQSDGKPHEALFWQRRNAAVRAGDWKMIHLVTRDGAIELYNLKDDIGEKNNVAAQHPDVVSDLRSMLEEWQSGHSDPMW